RKIQTRRPVKPCMIQSEKAPLRVSDDGRYHFWCWGEANCPFGMPGDLIYVRETFRRFDSSNECGCSDAPCGCPRTGTPIYFSDCSCSESKWTPSIHMPRWASRLTLKVTGVRVERVQDISKADAEAE